MQRRLGTGGMGSLYLARDPSLERLVALKLLKDELQDDPDLRERFTREARSVARLRHQHIIIVYEIGEADGRPFMAMEYIAGETLTHVLRRSPSLPLARRLSLVEDLCDGLAHAHAAGIIHRDIKPANIMLDAEGVLKILDFGIARLGSNSGMTQDGMMMGTVNYMSPEQVVGRGVDQRSDIFAAGAVLYELIALEQAFPGGIATGVLHRILNEGPVPLGERVPGVDPELAGIVEHALAREPAQRYQDANAMRRDIARVRRRLEAAGQEAGAASPRDPTVVLRPKTSTSDSGRKSESDPRRLNPQRFAELRRQQVEEHLRSGEDAFARGDHDAALQHAERAATVDPDSRTAFDLIDKARFAIESKAIRQLLAEARRLFSDGHLDDAAARADEAAVTLLPDFPGAAELRSEVRQTSEKIAAAQERERRITASLERARTSFEQGDYETALRAVYEALALAPERPDARELEQLAKSRLQARREHEQARQIAYERLDAARTLAGEGNYDEAIRTIEAMTPPSDTVRVAAVELLAAVRRRQHEDARAAIVSGARVAFERGRLEQALAALESIPADEQTTEVRSLRAGVEDARRQRRELEQKRHALEAAITATRALVESGDLAGALGRLEDAATLGLDDERIPAIRQQITDLAAAAAEERRRQETRDRLATKRVDAARQLLATGDGYAAVTLLERDGSGHPLVEAALHEIRLAVAEQTERVRQEAERRRQEEAKRRADAEAARQLEEQRQEAERQLEAEARRQREAEQRRQRDEVATLLVNAERALAADKPEEATLLLKRADEKVGSVEDTELRRRVKAAKVEAEQRREDARRHEEEDRRREAEAREREEKVGELLTRARHATQHGTALQLLDEALTLAPGDARVLTLIHERQTALDVQRADEQRRRDEARRGEEDRRLQEQEARRAAEIEAVRAREERQAAETQRREEEERREHALAQILAKAAGTAQHDAALTLLKEAETLAPGDPRVRTAVARRQAALKSERAEEERRQQKAREDARLEAERLAREERTREQLEREERARLEREAKEELERRSREETMAREAERKAKIAAAAAVAAQPAIDQTVVRPQPQQLPSRPGWITYLAAAAAVALVVAGGIWVLSPANGPVVPNDSVSVVDPPPLTVDQERLEQERLAKEKQAQEKQPQVKQPQETQAQEKLAQEKLAQEKLAQDKLAQEKLAQEKLAQEKLAQEKLAQEKLAQEKLAQEKAAQEKAAQDKLAQEKAAQEKAAQDKLAQEKAAQEKLAQDKLAREQAARDQLARDQAAIQQIADRYVAAYNRMDEASLRAIDPASKGIPTKALLKSVDLKLSQVSITVAPDGQSAVFRATLNFTYVADRARHPPTATGPLAWTLRKVGTTWRVIP